MTQTGVDSITPAAAAGASSGRADAVATTRVRSRRRPGLLAISVALICLGGLATGWAFEHSRHNVSVLAARHLIARGERIASSDLIVVSIGSDPALSTMDASAAAGTVGRYALTDIPSGTLLSSESVGSQLVPDRGSSLVGVLVTTGQMPSVGLEVGDKVDVLATGDSATASPPVAASVFHVSDPDDNQSRTVDLLVPSSQAVALARTVAGGHLAIILRSRAR